MMASSTDEVYWLLRLAHIVLQYSILMLIGALIVYTVKNDKFCPSYVRSFPLIKWFVYGKLTESIHSIQDPELQLPKSKDVDDERKLRSKVASDSHKFNLKTCVLFLYCFTGLQISFLIWGIFQEKIMTTDYDWSPSPSYQVNELVSFHPSPRKIRFRNSQVLILISRIFAFSTAVLLISLSTLKCRRFNFILVSLDSIRIRLLKSVPPVEYVKLMPEKDCFNSSRDESRKFAPFYEFSYCSLSNILSSWCQYEALKYVNFPTQVVSKTCKLIPVMLMSHFISGKRYKLHQYSIAVFISIGISFFLFGNHLEQSKSQLHSNTSHLAEVSTVDNSGTSKNTKSYSLIDGLLILSLYLLFDSFTSNWQKKLMKDYDVSSLNLMASTNLYSILFAFSSLASQALIVPAIHIILSCDQLLHDCLILAISSVTGQLFIFYTISQFGPVTFTLITTVRQPIAIILSCLIYGHSLNLLSYSGLIVSFAAVFIKLYFDRRDDKT